jgi:hypothetical protein
MEQNKNPGKGGEKREKNQKLTEVGLGREVNASDPYWEKIEPIMRG